jgi:hypothetical protein
MKRITLGWPTIRQVGSSTAQLNVSSLVAATILIFSRLFEAPQRATSIADVL